MTISIVLPCVFRFCNGLLVKVPPPKCVQIILPCVFRFILPCVFRFCWPKYPPPVCSDYFTLCVQIYFTLCVQILLPFNLFRFSAPNIPAAIHLAVRIVLLIFVDRNLKKENNKKFKGCDSSFEVNIFQILSYHFFYFQCILFYSRQ